MKELWCEKYRPKKVDDYVWKDSSQKEQVEEWIKEKTIPHILLSGSPGVGKTTLAKVLVNELNVNRHDFLEVNASSDRGIDTIRDKISNFAMTIPFGDFKIILLDEADYLTRDAQAGMRNLMESYADNCRFILTCNYPNKIIDAINSRTQGFHVEKVDHTEFTARCATILVNENVDFDLEVLDSYVKATYPDLRKCINLIQMGSVNGKLQKTTARSSTTQDYKLKMVELFKEGRVLEARRLACSNVRVDEIDEFFRWTYDNLELWSKTQEGQDKAILIIRDALVNHSMVSDPEINLAACLCELTSIEESV